MQISISTLASWVNGHVEGDPDALISSVGKIEDAKPGDIAFFANEKYEKFVYTTQASAVLVSNSYVLTHKVQTTLIRVEDPYLAFTLLLEKVQSASSSSLTWEIHPTVLVGTSTLLPSRCAIGPYVCISDNVQIGEDVRIDSHCFIDKNEELAKKYAASVTLGAGQFCTNPGLLLAIESPQLNIFKKVIADSISTIPSATMLTEGIAKNYIKLSAEVTSELGVEILAASTVKNEVLKNQSEARIAQVNAVDFIKNPKLREEIFGPYSLLVVATNLSELEETVEVLEGQLTVTIMAAKDELKNYTSLLHNLTDKTGRIILNGVPTGVEVCAAMQHGGPFPATNDSRFTSVGSTAVSRFVRPLAYQDWDQDLLPDELKDGNPLGIFRRVNQLLTK